MRLTALCGLCLCLLLTFGTTNAQQLVVDCDAGDDLALALEQAESTGLSWIAVEGRCEGNFEFEPSVATTIEGIDATLVSPGEGVVIRIGGSGLVKLKGFEIRSGSLGLQSVGTDAWVIVNDCEVHDNGVGLSSRQGSQLNVTFSDIHDNNLGLHCQKNSECSASYTTIRNNGGGINVEGQSALRSSSTQISGNSVSGVLVNDRSTANFDQTAFAENSLFHIAVIDRSHAELENGTTLGSPSDGTDLALAAVLMSYASTSQFGEPAELFGDVLAADSSYLIIDSAQVSGDLEIIDFAKVKLVRSTVAGSVLCQSAGDAVCGEGSSARLHGCASARPNCSPHPSNNRPRHGEFPGRARRFTLEDVSGR